MDICIHITDSQVAHGKESACQAGDEGLIPGSGRSTGEGNGNPLQYSCLGNPVGGGALAGYSPWGHKEADMTQWLKNRNTANSLCCISETDPPL